MTCLGWQKFTECVRYGRLDEDDLVCSFALVGPGVTVATVRAVLEGELVPGEALRETIDRWCVREHALRADRWPHRSIPADEWWGEPEAA